jgi:hypothetical protein
MRKPNRKRSPRTSKTTTTQAKHRDSQTKATPKWNSLIVRKESLHNNGKQWATWAKGIRILLDNGSTLSLLLSLFGNPNIVKNIRESKTTLELATNAGTKTTKQIADVPGFGMVWYDETAIANIFGPSDLKKKNRITFDSEKEDAFIYHTDKGNMKFKCNPEGLYTFEVSDKYLQKESHVINTVKRIGLDMGDCSGKRKRIAAGEKVRQHVPHMGCVIGVSAVDQQTCTAKCVNIRISHTKYY